MNGQDPDGGWWVSWPVGPGRGKLGLGAGTPARPPIPPGTGTIVHIRSLARLSPRRLGLGADDLAIARRTCLLLVGCFLVAILARLLLKGDFITPDALFPALFLLALILGRGHIFLLDWLPFLGLLLGYEALRGIADDVNTRIHWTAAIRADQLFALGEIPSKRLQDWLYPTPNAITALTVASAFLYLMHFVVPVIAGGLLWWRDRRHYWRFTATLLAASFAGFLTFIAIPVAPPWMAGNERLVPHIYRVIPRTLGVLFEDRSTVDYVWSRFTSNPVAAFPSLHAAYPLIVALTLIRISRSRLRWLTLAYPAAMGFAIVYGGEHYLVDVLAGYAYALACFWAVERLFARSGRRGGTDAQPAAG